MACIFFVKSICFILTYKYVETNNPGLYILFFCVSGTDMLCGRRRAVSETFPSKYTIMQSGAFFDANLFVSE